MKFAFATAALTAFAAAEEYMQHAAVLVAGSNGYWNYRHQADVAHAHQIMRANGIPAENIITMMYDDVASSSQNPYPGQLFNHPDGDNVYDASTIDYRLKDVTPQNFLAVLKGDAKTATGKVLNTGPDSKIFVYFADHGAPGFVCFPMDNLYADDLQATIDEMQANQKYGQMTFYIEACESGSMFPSLRSDQNVYAVTASNDELSSWAAYCSPQDFVHGIEIGSCLGDLFSVNWMEDTEGHNPNNESLQTQYENVRDLTYLSPVMQFGDLSIASEPVGDFEGIDDDESMPLASRLLKLNQGPVKSTAGNSTQDSRDVKMHYLYRQLQRNNAPETHQELIDELQHRLQEDTLFAELFPHHEGVDLVKQPYNFDCLRFLVTVHDKSCGRFSDYSLKHAKHFVHACETQTPEVISLLGGAIEEACALY